VTTFSVIIPSFRRSAALAQCLAGIDRMSKTPNEVAVVLRPDDSQARSVADAAGARIIDVLESGHLPPLVAAISACRTDVVGVLDDDAVPRAEWLARIIEVFVDPETVAVTGPVRDIDPKGHEIGGERAARRTVRRLASGGGRTWYRGFAGLPPPHASEWQRLKHPCEVATIQGGNAAYRLAALKHVGIDLSLNRGAANGYEADLALGLRRLGRVLFDPELVVDHYPAKRAGAPDRDEQITYIEDYTYNLFYIAAKHFGSAERAVFRAYMAAVGQRPSPGFLRIPSVAASAGIPARRLMKLMMNTRRCGARGGRSARPFGHGAGAC
jgi:GT2 family glycosyltransferase